MARKKVTSVPALADWGAVDNALRDIRECQHTLAEMAVQRDRQIDSIKADYAQGALPLQNRVKALESEVKAYVDLHRAELDGKSRALNFGTVGYRVSSKLMFHTKNVLRRIQKYMPYRTGATIKLTVAQTDPRVPEIVTEEPQVVYLYNGVSRSGKPLNYTKTKNPLAGGHWDRALVAAEGDALAADLERYIGKRSGE